MLSILQKRAANTLSGLIVRKNNVFRSSLQVNRMNFGFNNSTLQNTRPDILSIGAALILSISGMTYGILSSKDAKESVKAEELSPAKMTKKEAKLLIEEALKFDAEGNNEKALELYNSAYRTYRRANKASDKKLTFLRQRIAILTSFAGKDKRAVLSLTEGFQSVGVKTLTEELHFELYYDLCVMYYKFGQYTPSTTMFHSCLDLAKMFHSNEPEIFAAIHQFLGFNYYKRGKPEKGEKHLTKALQHLNTIKADNKAFLFYACTEFCDFYTSMGDYKKALLFLEQARVLINQDSFFNPETIAKGMKIHSAYTQKFIQDLRKESQLKDLDAKSRMLKYKLGDYNLNNNKKNNAISKLTKHEKNTSIHGLLNW